MKAVPLTGLRGELVNILVRIARVHFEDRNWDDLITAALDVLTRARNSRTAMTDPTKAALERFDEKFPSHISMNHGLRDFIAAELTAQLQEVREAMPGEEKNPYGYDNYDHPKALGDSSANVGFNLGYTQGFNACRVEMLSRLAALGKGETAGISGAQRLTP